MFILGVAVVLSLATVGFFVTSQFIKEQGLGYVSLGAGCVLTVLLAANSWVIVSPGEVGIPVFFGKILNFTYESGFNLCNPFMSVEHLPVRTTSYVFSRQTGEGDKEHDDSLNAITKDSLVLNMDITVIYQLNPQSASFVYRSFGNEEAYKNKILRPAIATAVREAMGHFDAHEAYSTKREEVSEKIRTKLAEVVNKSLTANYKDAPAVCFSFPSVLVREILLPKIVLAAMEAKQAADLEQQRMDFTIQREKKLAEQRRIEGGGIKAFQDIVSKGVSESMLEWKRIEAQFELAKSPNAKVIIIPDNLKLPLILGEKP